MPESSFQTAEAVAPLEQSLRLIREAQARDKQVFEATMNDYIRREQAVEKAIAEVRGMPGSESNGNGSAAPAALADTLSISPERREAVEKYLRKVKSARQSDIAKKAGGGGLNSGTVSVALRILEAEGLIGKADKENGSQVWVWDANQEAAV